MKLIKNILLVLLVLLIFGCGTTNLLEWTKAPSKVSDIELAKTYLDEGNYEKAIQYLNAGSSDAEENILYAQCEMGLAGVQLAEILTELADENPTENILKLQDLAYKTTDRTYIFDAADRFDAYPPSDSSDKVIAALCGMVAYSQKIRENFDPHNDGIDDDPGSSVDSGQVVTSNWVAMGGKHTIYLNLSITNLTSISGDDSLTDAVESMSASLNTLNELAISTNAFGGTYNCNNDFTWDYVKPLLLR